MQNQKRTLRPLTCETCGRRDVSEPGHVGTDVKMRCPDCCNATDPHARKCRNCCPTGHGTKWPALENDNQ